MKVKFFALVLFVFCANIIDAQTDEVLTNKTVIELVKAGLDNSTVLSKIASSKCQFNVSTSELISLKKNNIPSEIITAMVNKSNAPTANDKGSNQASAAPVVSTLSEINYYDTKTKAAKPLEKQKADMNTKGMVMQSTIIDVPNGASTSRFLGQDSICFIVGLTEAQGDPSGWFTLYKAESKHDKRSAPFVKVNALGKQSTKDVISFSSRNLGNAVFELIPDHKLDKGEYFFMAKGTMANYAGSAVDVFAFGID